MPKVENAVENKGTDTRVVAQLEERFKDYESGHPVNVHDLVSSIVDHDKFGLDWLNRQLALLKKPFRVVKMEDTLYLISQ
jgi:hypothetical protein